MFDVAPTEMLVIGLVALIAIGPKQLPAAMRLIGQCYGKVREFAGHFRLGIEELMDHAEREERTKAFREAEAARLRSEALLAEQQATRAAEENRVTVPDVMAGAGHQAVPVRPTSD